MAKEASKLSVRLRCVSFSNAESYLRATCIYV